MWIRFLRSPFCPTTPFSYLLLHIVLSHPITICFITWTISCLHPLPNCQSPEFISYYCDFFTHLSCPLLFYFSLHILPPLRSIPSTSLHPLHFTSSPSLHFTSFFSYPTEFLLYFSFSPLLTLPSIVAIPHFNIRTLLTFPYIPFTYFISFNFPPFPLIPHTYFPTHHFLPDLPL